MKSSLLQKMVTLPCWSREQSHTLREGPIINHPKEKTMGGNLQVGPKDTSLLLFATFIIPLCCVWVTLSDSILLNAVRWKWWFLTRRLGHKRQHGISFLCSLPLSPAMPWSSTSEHMSRNQSLQLRTSHAWGAASSPHSPLTLCWSCESLRARTTMLSHLQIPDPRNRYEC